MDAMKAKIKNMEKEFQPFQIEITFETQWEAEFFGTLFNHAGIADGQFDGLSVDEFCRKIYTVFPDKYQHLVEKLQVKKALLEDLECFSDKV